MKLSPKPLHDYVLIESDEAETVTKSGLILHTEENKKVELGTVLEVGSGMKSGLKKGDRILYKSYVLEEIVIDDESYMFLKESDVIAKV